MKTTTARATKPKITAADLLQMLRRHHGLDGPAEEWAGGTLVPEVSANGPFGDGRRADAIYIGYTAASGRCMKGYELKTSSADWRREIARAADKADQWADQCHEWWIVVSNSAIVKDGELPQGWGLMSPPTANNRLMTVHVQAERKRHLQPSWDAVRSVMARQETLRAKTIKDQLWQIELENRRKIRAEIEAEFAERRGPETAELQRRLRLIQDALGVPLDWGDHATNFALGVDAAVLTAIGEAIKQHGTIHDAVESIVERFASTATSLRGQLDYLDRRITEFKSVTNQPAAHEPA
ncbi:hypothetical protein [Mycobacteroides abscessus]|uniref:hypothetical protein n=1 Tax=Mycobacteroides abscessus TaxID=36809 RepID=UPI0009C4A297|nr:hypothetical protein [Mycobacteroides abscessus]SLH39608.1 Uncharacterised protein [Mycobacteroides abscessus subsp. massiliense]